MALIVVTGLLASTPGVRADELVDVPATSMRPVSYDDLSPEGRARTKYLWQRVMCDCPKENYSRTLDNCPDSCANPQKNIVVGMVREGRSDEEVYQVMLERAEDQRVLAAPEHWMGKPAYVLPFIVGLIGLFIAAKVVSGWRRSGGLEKQRRQEAATLLSDEEIERVERELAGFE